MKHRIRYCVDCGWRIRDDAYDDPTARMIDHATETGHDLDSSLESDDDLALRPGGELSSHREYR